MSKVELLLVPEFKQLMSECESNFDHAGDIEFRAIAKLSKKYKLDSNKLYDLYEDFINCA